METINPDDATVIAHRPADLNWSFVHAVDDGIFKFLDRRERRRHRREAKHGETGATAAKLDASAR